MTVSQDARQRSGQGQDEGGNRALSRVRRRYYLLTGLYWFATALPMPTLVLLQRERGMDLFEVGVLTAVYSIIIVLCEVPTGGLADAWGRRTVSVIAFCVIAAAKITFSVAASFLVFALAFVVFGVGRALISGALEAWFVDEVLRLAPEEELQRSLAYANTVTLFALSSASLLGGYLPSLLSEIAVMGRSFSGLAAPPAAAAVLMLLTAGLTARLVVEPRPAHEHGHPGGIVLSAFRETTRNSTLLLLAGLSLVAGAAISTMETFWQPFFSDTLGTGTPTVLFGVITAGSFLFAMVGNVASPELTRLLGGRPARLAAILQGFRGLFMFALALQTANTPAVGAFWLAYMVMGAGESPHQTLINRNVRAEHRSAMLSVQSLATSLGAFAGAGVFGYIARSAGLRTVWIVTAVYLVLSLVMYLRVDARENRSNRVQHVAAQTNLSSASS
ncbi:MAG: MFS transporter [Spirochaetota bacterium]